MSFQLCGRRITISFFFTALVAFVLFCDARGTAVSGLMAAGCHEAGHLLMMASLGVPVLEFRFTPFGVEMIRGEGGRIGYFSDALVSFSGPLANILVFLACLAESGLPLRALGYSGAAQGHPCRLSGSVQSGAAFVFPALSRDGSGARSTHGAANFIFCSDPSCRPFLFASVSFQI